MRKIALAFAFFWMCAIATRGQGGFTTVTGTITDPNGIKYACGTISAQLVTAGGPSPTLNGGGFSTSTSPIGLGCPTTSGTGAPGSFAMRLADSGVINPSNTTWKFTVNMTPGIPPPAGTGPQSFTFTTAINCGTNTPATCTANVMDISAQLSALAPALGSGGGGGITPDSGPATIITTNLIAQYPMTEGTGTVLHDTSAAGNNGTLCPTTQAPTWISGSPIGGLQFTGSSNQCVTLPASLNGAQTIEIFVGVQSSTGVTPYTNTTETLVGGSSTFANSLVWALQQNGANNGGLHMDSLNHNTVSWLSVAGGAFNGNGLLSFVLSGSGNDTYYVNSTPTFINQVGSSQGAQSAGNLQLGLSQGLAFTGQMYYALFYSAQLTAAQVAQNTLAVQSIIAQRALPIFNGGAVTDTNDQIVMDGDSETSGLNWPLLGLTPNQFLQDVGIPGATCASLPPLSSLDVDTMYRPFAYRNTAVMWCGTNILAGGVPATIANLRGYCQARHAIGWKCLITTMMDRAGESLFHDQLNAAMGSAWPNFADGIVDIGANVHLGADGANANLSYFSDGIHPTAYADNNIIGPNFIHATNRLWGNTQIAGNFNTYNGVGTTVPQFVQGASGLINGSASGTIVFSTGTAAFNNTAGDFLIVNIICQQSCTGITVSSVTGCTDTFNSVSPLVNIGGAASFIQAFYAMNIAGGACTITVALSASASNVLLLASEYSGVALAAALDVNSVYATGTGAAMSSANVTTTVAGDLLLGLGGTAQGFAGGVFGISPGTGYIYRTSNSGGNVIEDKISGAAGSYNATMTLTSSVCCNWALGVAAFKPIAASTSTYNLLDVDVYAECNPTGGNVALNLPDASWMTGETVTIKNIQTAGANTCTINGITPLTTGVAQTIDGSATFTLANKATAIFKSVLTFTGVAGTNLSPLSNWIQVNF